MKFSGYEIRVLRMAKQLKQHTVAKKMKISEQRYSQLENYAHIPDDRANEILSILDFTKESAKEFLKLCAPPSGKDYIIKLFK